MDNFNRIPEKKSAESTKPLINISQAVTIIPSTSPEIPEGKFILLNTRTLDCSAVCPWLPVTTSTNLVPQFPVECRASDIKETVPPVADRMERNPDTDNEGKVVITVYASLGLHCFVLFFQNTSKSKQPVILQEWWDWAETYWIITSNPNSIKSPKLKANGHQHSLPGLVH